jgi:non-specific serine/threonine protein kinase/serine/threonine-protein kinase
MTADGMPYMVMEYIAGLPITEHCEKNGWGARQRMELFRTVCSAVHFAHQRLVVHRDLKPGNILVTPDGTPVLLDFGIAKMLDPLTPGGAATTKLFRPFTPGYASPEQLRGVPTTTATDVYSLGVILYELLAGAPPYQLEGLPLDEAIRIVSETLPPGLSAHRTEAGLPFSDDLDFLTLKAMRKEPVERYGSGQELADDVKRYLDGMPVVARRGSLRYLVRKMIARHKVAVAAAAAGLALAVAGVGAVAWEAHIANQQRAKAQSRFDQLRGLARSLIFELHDDIATLAGSTEVRKKLVTRALSYLDSLAAEAAGDQQLQIELAAAYNRLGDVQGSPRGPNLGDPIAALASYRKGIQLARAALARHPQDDYAQQQLGLLHARIAEIQILREEAREDARDNLQQALKIFRPRAERAGAPADARSDLANALLDMFLLTRQTNGAQSVPFLDQALQLYEARLSEQPNDDSALRDVALAHRYWSTISTVYTKTGWKGNTETELLHLRRSLELDERRSAAYPSDAGARLDVSTDLSEIGHCFLGIGKAAEALQVYRRALAIRADLAAADPKNMLAHTRLGFAHLSVGGALDALKDNAGALESFRRSIAIFTEYTASNPSDELARIWLTAGYQGAGASEERLGRRSAACNAYRNARATVATVSPSGSQRENVDYYATVVQRGLSHCGDM